MQNTTNSRLAEEINIRNLRPNCVYHFRVVAYNNYGSGSTSKSLTVTTLAEENVPSAPQKFTAYATSSHSIRVSWEPSEIPNGRILRYIVYYVEVSKQDTILSFLYASLHKSSNIVVCKYFYNVFFINKMFVLDR